MLAALGLLLFFLLRTLHAAATRSRRTPPRSHSQHFVAQRSTADGTSAALAYQRARAQAAALCSQSLAASRSLATWQPLGPVSILSPTFGNLTGRITALALDANDTTGNTLYVGTTGGGVWKSTNAATASPTFTPLTDTLPIFAAGTGTNASLSIGALAVQPLANPVLLAGTGDPNDATDSYYGEGILRSTDGGLTWTLLAGSHDGANGNHSFAGLATAAIAFSSATPTLVVAAFTTSPESSIAAAANPFSIPGLYYSTDAGKTWQMSTIMDGAQIVQTPQPLGTGQVGNATTAVVWDPLRLKFFAAVRAHGYYSSPDGVTWTRLTAQPGTNLTTAKCPVGVNGLGNPATCPIFRGALAVQPTTGDLYALTVDANSLDQGLWQNLCNATSGTCSTAPTFTNRIDNAALEAGGSGAITQGTYNLTLAAEPAASNSTLLFVGTVDLYRCALSAGSSACTLRNTTDALNGCSAPAMVAPAQHALATLVSTAPLIFIGNDGGLWRSLDGVAETGSVCSSTDASHFNNLNSTLGSLAEITDFAQHPTDPNTLLAGLGANGSAATTSAAALDAWPQLSASEGGFPSLDPTTPTNWYLAIGAGVNLKQCALGSSCTASNFAPPATIGAAQVANDNALLDAPTLLDPAQPTNLLVATCRVWRGPAASNSTWSTANAISPAFNGSATPCTGSSPLIRSLAAGGPSTTSTNSQNSGSEVIYAGLAGALDGGANIAGHLFVTKSAELTYTANSWTDIARSPVTNDANAFNAAGFDVSAIAVDPHDATGATVYATIMGFGVPHLYRSVDFGAHWFNISNNLPDAPANAVLVDPNDTNTVYIALDTGVYVTTAVLTCSTATANCWSPLGTGLPNAPVVALSAAANIPTGDGRLGMLRVATYGRGLWQQPLLTAVTPAQPALTLSASSFTFAAQQVSTQSAAQTLTVTSSGNAPVTFGALVVSGDFTETDNCAYQTLAVNATCTLQISFAPTVIGGRSGQLTLYANISGGQANVSLSGTGTAAAAITFTPPALSFAATLVNQTTAAQNIVVANTGGTAATLQTPAITGVNAADFAISANTCGTTLGASTGCTLSVTFTPSASGARTAQLSLTDSAGTQTAALTGTGNPPATDTLSTNTLTFAQQTIGTTSAAQSVTLTNNGDVALTLITTSVTCPATSPPPTPAATRSPRTAPAPFRPTSYPLQPARAPQRSLSPINSGRKASRSAEPASHHPASRSCPSHSPSLRPESASPPPHRPSPSPTTAARRSTSLPSPHRPASPSRPTPASPRSPSTPPAPCKSSSPPPPQAHSPARSPFSTTLPRPRKPSRSPAPASTSPSPPPPQRPPRSPAARPPSAVYNLQLSSLSTLSGNVALTCTGAPVNSICTVTPSTAALGSTVPVNVTVLIDTKAQLAPPFPFRATGIVLALLFPAAFFTAATLPQTFASRRLSSFALICITTALSGCGAALHSQRRPHQPQHTPRPPEPTTSPSAPPPPASPTPSASRSSFSSEKLATVHPA